MYTEKFIEIPVYNEETKKIRNVCINIDHIIYVENTIINGIDCCEVIVTKNTWQDAFLIKMNANKFMDEYLN